MEVEAPIILPTRAESLIAEGLAGRRKDMLATFAGIGLVFIAVVVLSIVTMFYVMLRQT